MNFKAYFKKELENQIRNLPQVLTIKDKDQPPEIKVARVNFAYDNAKLQDSLAERGILLKNGSFNKVTKIEEEINKDVEMNAKIYKRPVHAFVIFES